MEIDRLIGGSKAVGLATLLLVTGGGCSRTGGEVPEPPFQPHWSSSGHALTIAQGTAPVPTGLYAMIRLRQCQPSGGGPSQVRTIVGQPFVQALALGITWEDLEPQRDAYTFATIEACLDEIAEASRLAGRREPMPVFLRLYVGDFTPPWMMSATSDDGQTEPHIVTNAIGMKVLRMPPHRDASGRQIEAREHPLSTDPVYHSQLERMMQTIAEGLDRVDPDARRVPLIYAFGPAMNSNQMRVPRPDLFPNKGEDPWRAGWTKAGHIQAWKDVGRRTARFPAFAKRVWVFNMTNLVRPAPALNLTRDDQKEVFDALCAVHPAGPKAVVAKEESFTVDFGRKDDKTPTGPQSQWRVQTLNRRDQIPYYFIASLPLQHAWEVWAGLSYKRDKRAPAQYPFATAVENSLFIDLDAPQPDKPQGTLWVEIWMEEALQPEKLRRFDDSTEPLADSLRHWDEAIRTQLHRLVPAS